jgi:cAMP phosphodiesterase
MIGEKISYKNFNFQGIECIDDEIYIISNFDNKIYKLSENFKLEEFLDTSIIYKNRAIFSHITSFYIRNNIFYGVNSLDKINGIIVKTPILNDRDTKKIVSLPHKITRLKTHIKHKTMKIRNHSNVYSEMTFYHFLRLFITYI